MALWPSPITVAQGVAASFRYRQAQADGDTAYWLETRPSEGGRSALMRRRRGQRQEALAGAPNVRSKVHEYGGGDYLACGGRVFYIEAGDQQGYEARDAGGARLTQAPTSRFSDLCLDQRRNSLIAVCEEHSGAVPINSLVRVGANGSAALPPTIAHGRDFYAYPRLSPDGSTLAFITWSLPDMPWDGAELHVAAVNADGTLGSSTKIAGGGGESVLQPTWSADGRLHFVADRSGWWNLYRLEQHGPPAPLSPQSAEFGFPLWVLGRSSYGFARDGTIWCAFRTRARWQVARIDPRGTFSIIETELSEIEHLTVCGDHALAIGGGPRLESGVYLVSPSGSLESLSGAGAGLPGELLPACELFDLPSGAVVQYYPPRAPGRAASGAAPLMVAVHGGPTGAASLALRPSVAFWTSRGVGIAEVDYRGSTGYGRKFREQLYGAWGLADVDDCVEAARLLCRLGRADPRATIIRGGSAGGFTALAALAGDSPFAGAIASYPVTDLEANLAESHKFEAGSFEALIGPLPSCAAEYRRRSPMSNVAHINKPVLVMQGEDDRVVPKHQTDAFVAALRARGVAVEYLTFPGEGHGFRGKVAMERALEAELEFVTKLMIRN